MIWIPIPLLVLLDLGITFLVLATSIYIYRARESLRELKLWDFFRILAIALLILVSHNLFVLISMFPLPFKVGEEAANQIIWSRHLNAGWIVFVSMVSIICGSLLYTIRKTIPSIADSQKNTKTFQEETEAALQDSQERVRVLSDAGADYIWEMDENLRFSFFSGNFSDQTGLSQEKSIGKTLQEVPRPLVDEENWQNHLAALEAHKPFQNFLQSRILPSGEIVHFSISGKPSFDSTGKFKGYRATGTNITKLQDANNALSLESESVQLLQRITSASNEALDPNEALQIGINEVCNFLHWPVGHVYSLSLNEPDLLMPTHLWHLEQKEKFKNFVKITEETPIRAGIGLPGRVLAAKKPSWIVDLSKDTNLPRAKIMRALGVQSGLAFPVLVGMKVVAVLEFFSETRVEPDDRTLELIGNVGTLLGRVIERRNAEKELHASQRLLETVFDTLPIGVFVMDREGKHILTNDLYSQSVGLPKDKILNLKFDELKGVTEDEKEFARKTDQNVFEGGAMFDDPERQVTKPDGQIVWLHVIKRPVRDPSGGIIGLVGIRQEITERKLAEEALRESEKKFKDLVEGSHEGIFVHRDFKPLFVNQAYARIFGFESPEDVLKLESFESLIHPDDFSMLSNRIEGLGEEEQISPLQEYRGVRKDGELIFLVTNFMTILWGGEKAKMGTIFDLSEIKLLEQHLRQSQKMEAVGQLAGGLAHDFNNMLHIIEGYAQLALRSIRANKERNIGKDLDKILQASQSASEITGQLLSFSRQQVVNPTALDVNQVIENLMKMIGRLIGENVAFSLSLGDALGSILGDRGMLEQVLVNLCVNARDAMANGGRLAIETSRFRTDESFCAVNEWAKLGDYVVISVSDTGKGIAKEYLQHLFEPFFTTKESGEGTGLGLSVVYGIVQQHEGHISVFSEVGVGTTFKIFLPTSDHKINSEILPDAKQTVGGKETILVAEDEPAVLELMVGTLEEMGYTVLTAKDGVDACEVFDAHSGSLDLAMIDVILPKMAGREVYDYIHQVNPSLPVLFSTGYTANAIDSDFLAETGLKLLQKPYSPTTLLHTVRAVLDGDL